MTRRALPPPRLAHRLLCVLMAWVMLVAPVIVTAGEIHEFGHVTHAQAPVDDTPPATATTPPGDADGGLMHDLAEATQCCSHTTALLPDTTPFVISPTHSEATDGAVTTRDGRFAFLPFRPPIRA